MYSCKRPSSDNGTTSQERDNDLLREQNYGKYNLSVFTDIKNTILTHHTHELRGLPLQTGRTLFDFESYVPEPTPRRKAYHLKQVSTTLFNQQQSLACSCNCLSVARCKIKIKCRSENAGYYC